MTILCKYKDAFGKPGEGVHAIRLGNLAVVDVLVTLVGAFILAAIVCRNSSPNNIGPCAFVFAIALFIVGEAAHWLFCVDTSVMRMIRGNAGHSETQKIHI